MKRTAILVCCAAPLLLTGVALTAERQHEVARTITVYSGQVDQETANRFLSLISHNVDRVIGLKVSVEPSDDASISQSGYLAEVDRQQFVISKSDLQNGGIEIVTSGNVGRDAGMYVVDGIFIVKAGGMHQGVASFGLQPIDEASVRLNPSVKISEQPF